MELFSELDKHGTIIIVLMYDPTVAGYCKGMLKTVDGEIIQDSHGEQRGGVIC